MDKVQNDIVILMLESSNIDLESLTVPEKQNAQADVMVNKDIAGVISASRLFDVKHPDIVMDILEDGCRITSYTCQQFQLSQPRKKM